jgi:tetratricopeptide (TPR) repeat protein
MTDQKDSNSALTNSTPELAEAKKLILAGELLKAEEVLEKFLSSDKLPSISEQLYAYGNLIRIACETRNFEKITNYIAVIKAMPLESDQDKIQFAQCLYMTGMGWLHSGNYEKARQNFNQSLEVVLELKNDKIVFLNRIALVELLRLEGNFQEVLNQTEALSIAAEATGEKTNLGNVWVLLGNVYRKQGNYNSAIDAYHKAKEVFGDNKNSGDYHYALWALGTSYAAIEDKEKAKIYLDLARQPNAEKGFEFWRINILSTLTLAELKTVLGDFSRAEELYTEVANAAGEDENTYYGRRVLRGQTLLAIKRGDFDKANDFIDKLVIVAVREKSSGEMMRLRLLKAEVLLRNGDAAQHDEARTMLEEALAYFQERGVRRHQGVCLELLARLDSRSGYPHDAYKKVTELLELAKESSYERLLIRALLAKLVLERKLGQQSSDNDVAEVLSYINKLNSQAERTILSRFSAEGYDTWSKELARLDTHQQRYVNEFFEDFHFVPSQSIDMEIDQNSHYVREKHLGEIPFHNKFTLMRILCLLAETPGKEYSKEDLALEIWGQDYNPLRHDNNIYININRLRKLVEPNPRESRYIMNGSRGYYFNPAMKVNISTKISDVAPRMQSKKGPGEGPRP